MDGIFTIQGSIFSFFSRDPFDGTKTTQNPSQLSKYVLKNVCCDKYSIISRLDLEGHKSTTFISIYSYLAMYLLSYVIRVSSLLEVSNVGQIM